MRFAVITFALVLAGCTATNHSAPEVVTVMPPTLVNQTAPAFTAPAVMPDNSLGEVSLSDYRGKYVVMFFFPMAFSIVCPTEVFAFNQRVADFKALDCELMGISVDSRYTLRAWRNTPFEQGGIGQISYPLVADIKKDISRAYGVLHDESVSLRGLFIIDPKGDIRHVHVNDFAVGRNVDEILRTLGALQIWDKEGMFCPANWRKGDTLLDPKKR